jgi:hypothetical protein
MKDMSIGFLHGASQFSSFFKSLQDIIFFHNASDKIKAKKIVAHGTNDSDDSESNARSGDNKCQGSR